MYIKYKYVYIYIYIYIHIDIYTDSIHIYVYTHVWKLFVYRHACMDGWIHTLLGAEYVVCVRGFVLARICAFPGCRRSEP